MPTLKPAANQSKPPVSYSNIQNSRRGSASQLANKNVAASGKSSMPPTAQRNRGGGAGAMSSKRMLNELKRPMDKPPVLYSQKSDNRDTFLIRRPESRDREDKITVHAGVAG